MRLPLGANAGCEFERHAGRDRPSSAAVRIDDIKVAEQFECNLSAIGRKVRGQPSPFVSRESDLACPDVVAKRMSTVPPLAPRT